jgi:urea transport system permease protein
VPLFAFTQCQRILLFLILMKNRLLAGVFVAQLAILFVAAMFPVSALALTLEQARAMAVGESDARIEALNKAVIEADEKTAAFIQALADDAVKVGADRLVVIKVGKSFDPVSGAEAPVPDDAQDVVNNNRMRSELDSALAALQLFSKKALVRAMAAQALAKEPDAAKLPLIEKALAAETDEKIKADLGRARAMVLLAAAEPAKRLEAAQALAASKDPGMQLLLNERISTETDPAIKAQLQATLRAINSGLQTGETLAAMFTGLSLGSILLLAALGLAITYGLMGVINMAHGELIMIGAYATYVVQVLFRQYLPGAFDFYLLLAIPVAFAVSAVVGALMERSVIRFLYGRPLETLLATWGISLVLMQAVRSIFGAQNVGVENPSWMSGSLQLLPNLSLPYNRMLIVVFAVLVLAGVALLISKTRLGLFVRGVTQNRAMASCMGVNTARVDTYAFALGSGVAGLAGCALSQVGNVGPDLGQNYIVDSFMVVVLGGVGQLAGTVYAALGLGVLNKFLEGWTGAVLAKIMVLAFIIIFIQKRPQGLFAMKGRSAEA